MDSVTYLVVVSDLNDIFLYLFYLASMYRRAIFCISIYATHIFGIWIQVKGICICLFVCFFLGKLVLLQHIYPFNLNER